VNLILFDPSETQQPLPRTDRRATHILAILRRQPGDTFDAGLVNGPRGKATVLAIDDQALFLAFSWETSTAPEDPIALLVGLPRPQTARDILREATTLGVNAIHFVRTEKGDPNYAASTLWRSGEWRRHAIAGAEQAFATRIPHVTHGRPLVEALSALSRDGVRLALDNYATADGLSARRDLAAPLTLAIGGERGWSEDERSLLREHGFALVHLGPRVLRTETACLAALVLARAKLGLMELTALPPRE